MNCIDSATATGATTTAATTTAASAGDSTNAPAAAITTIDSLTREARRRGIQVHGAFQPPDIIPMVEARIEEHNKIEHGYYEHSGDFIEWKQTMDDLQEFLAILKSLPPKLPYEARPKPSPVNHAPTTHQKIQQLNKEIDEHIAKLPPAIQQQLTGVCPPSDQASDPRPTPVCGPSANASDASADAPSTRRPKPTSDSNVEQARQEYLAQLLREATSESPIDAFPPERQRALYELILENPYTVVVKMIAKPEPLGWNFQTSDTSLKRFKKRYEKILLAAERSAAFAEARSILSETGNDEESYMAAARRLLKIRLYKNAADPKGCDQELELIMTLLDRQRRTDLAERRVKVAEQRVAHSG